MYARITEAYKPPYSHSPGDGRSHGSGLLLDGCDSSLPPKALDFNTRYQVGKLPQFQPYPTLHPINNVTSDVDHEIERDLHQGAGWIQTQDNCSEITRSRSNLTTPTGGLPSKEVCHELISKVLANKYCRQILKKILVETDSPMEQTGGSGNNLSSSLLTSETIKNLVVYCLGGLLVLCLIEVVSRIGQFLRR